MKNGYFYSKIMKNSYNSMLFNASENKKTSTPATGPFLFVGVAGLEPTTSSSRTTRATGLRYTP